MLLIDWDPTLTPPHQQYVDNWGEPERDHIDHDNVPRRGVYIYGAFVTQEFKQWKLAYFIDRSWRQREACVCML